jgi:hypothetical protein
MVVTHPAVTRMTEASAPVKENIGRTVAPIAGAALPAVVNLLVIEVEAEEEILEEEILEEVDRVAVKVENLLAPVTTSSRLWLMPCVSPPSAVAGRSSPFLPCPPRRRSLRGAIRWKPMSLVRPAPAKKASDGSTRSVTRCTPTIRFAIPIALRISTSASLTR